MSDALTNDAGLSSNPNSFTEKLKALMAEYDVRGILLYVLPEDSGKGYHTFSKGHFYDNARLISEHSKEIKTRISHDLEGLI